MVFPLRTHLEYMAIGHIVLAQQEGRGKRPSC